MMRALLLLVLFIFILIGGLIAFTPLGFVMGQSGIGALGIGWAKTDGTISNGRVSGLYAGIQPIGDVALELKPLSLLSFQPTYDVQWGGAGGQGTAVLKLAGQALEAKDLRMRQEIGALEGLAPPVRAMGGSLDIEDGAFRLTQTGCESASGTVSTDTLTTLAAQYGRQFGEISGPVRCENGEFVLELEGQSDAGDQVTIDGRASLTGSGEFVTRVRTQDVQIIIALTQIGFTRENGEFVYRESRTVGLTQ